MLGCVVGAVQKQSVGNVSDGQCFAKNEDLSTLNNYFNVNVNVNARLSL